MKQRCLKNTCDAMMPPNTLVALLIFIVIGIIVLALISITFGIFTLIGMCLLIGAAFVLYMKKGAVTIAPNSVFMWLLIIGLILIGFGQTMSYLGMDIVPIDLSAIPGLEGLHNSIRVNGGGEL